MSKAAAAAAAANREREQQQLNNHPRRTTTFQQCPNPNFSASSLSTTTMLDLSNHLLDSSSSLPISDFLSVSSDHCDSPISLCQTTTDIPKVLDEEASWCCSWDQRLRFPIVHKDGICAGKNGVRIKVLSGVVRDRTKKAVVPSKSLEDHVKAWVEKKVESGVPERECFLPFLVNAPKMAECRICGKFIFSGENLACSVRGCQEPYHLVCVKEKLGFSASRNFKCPHHACFICKQRGYWRCIRCTVASHSKCAPWSDKVIYLKRQPGRAVCWRHPPDWRLDKKVNLFFPSSDRADVSLLDEQHEAPTSDVEEIFGRLPLPYIEEEFEIDLNWKDMIENKVEPPPYLHIRRNLYLVKKKREDADADIGCTNCSSDMCSEDCVCRVQSISCSKSCNCSETCTNRPFRKDKKVKVVKTQSCGWGVEAAELIKKGDFVIEYIGEVIDDALCEKRLWDMKYRGDQNFYMCEIRKDFTIDATFKGNTARFLNHSCDPNCKLEKWQVDGETRVGVFAARSIKVGEPLTYDYRFVHFGSMVTCCCGAQNCQGYLGTKRRTDKLDFCLDSKTDTLDFCWGSKRRRSSMTCLEIIHD